MVATHPEDHTHRLDEFPGCAVGEEVKADKGSETRAKRCNL